MLIKRDSNRTKNNKKRANTVKSRILFILHLPPPIHGAATVGKYISESIKIKSEFNADFINLSTSTLLTESGKGSIKKITAFLKLQIKVLQALLKTKYDLCYLTLTTNGPGFYKDLFVVLLFRLFNKKIIYHFHNKGISSAAKSRLNRQLYRFALKNSKCILISQYLYFDVKEYCQRGNVFYCANGIPASAPLTINKVKANAKAPCRLLFLSNMMAEKGVFTLLDACKQLQAKGFAFECDFVGGWCDITQEAFMETVRRNNLSNITFAHGPKYNEEKFSFLKKADIFLLPTYNDVFPLVILEAMQFALPIISTKEGGIPELVVHNKTGFLINKKNVDELVEKLEILIKNPDLRLQMGDSGAKRFKELYTLEKFEDNFINILNTQLA